MSKTLKTLIPLIIIFLVLTLLFLVLVVLTLTLGPIGLIIGAILFVLGFILLLAGGLIWILYKNKNSQNALQEIAQKHNLTYVDDEVTGTYKGSQIKLKVDRRHGSGCLNYLTNLAFDTFKYTDEDYTFCETVLPRSQRLLLNIESRPNRILGSSDFDNRFSVSCYDAQILQQFLSTGGDDSLMNDLLRAKDSVETIKITDKKIWTEESSAVSDVNKFEQMLDITSHLSRKIQSVRQTLPPAKWENQLLESWQTLADEYKLTIDPQNVRLHGNYKSYPVQIALGTEEGNWQTVLKLRFNRDLKAGLNIVPMGEQTDNPHLWIESETVKSGDRAFDSTFNVFVQNVALARHILKPDFCQHLFSLNSSASKTLTTDTEITVFVNRAINDIDLLRKYLDGMVLSAQMILR